MLLIWELVAYYFLPERPELPERLPERRQNYRNDSQNYRNHSQNYRTDIKNYPNDSKNYRNDSNLLFLNIHKDIWILRKLRVNFKLER